MTRSTKAESRFSSDADFLPSSICVMNGTEIPALFREQDEVLPLRAPPPVPIFFESCYNHEMQLKKCMDFVCPAAAIAFVYAVFTMSGIGCPIKFVTGISCLGCGMTRAWLSLLRLDVASAFQYHPLFALPPVAAIMYRMKPKTSIHIYRAVMLTIVLAFIMIHAYRLVCADKTIVTFEPGNNILFRILGHKK